MIFVEAAVPLLLAFLLGVAHFWGEKIDEYTEPYGRFITDFTAGVTVSYIFLFILPELSLGSQIIGGYEFIAALAGFSAVYVFKGIEAAKGPEVFRKDFKEFHSLFLFLYYLLIGFTFYNLSTGRIYGVLFLFIPVVLHTVFSSLAIKELHEDVLDNNAVRAAISSAAVLGVSLAYHISVSESAFYIVFGLVSGMFLFVVLHDSLGSKSRSPIGYISGLTVYSALFVLLWLIMA